MHRQMLARYDAELLSHNLPRVQPFTPNQWANPIPEGYHPEGLQDRLARRSRSGRRTARCLTFWRNRPRDTSAQGVDNVLSSETIPGPDASVPNVPIAVSHSVSSSKSGYTTTGTARSAHCPRQPGTRTVERCDEQPPRSDPRPGFLAVAQAHRRHGRKMAVDASSGGLQRRAQGSDPRRACRRRRSVDQSRHHPRAHLGPSGQPKCGPTATARQSGYSAARSGTRISRPPPRSGQVSLSTTSELVTVISTATVGGPTQPGEVPHPRAIHLLHSRREHERTKR